jgi:hypothetical protein
LPANAAPAPAAAVLPTLLKLFTGMAAPMLPAAQNIELYLARNSIDRDALKHGPVVATCKT